MFGSPETTTGGRALKFYSSIRLDIRRTDSIKIGNALVGNHVRVKVVKNKVAPPFKQAEFDIIFGKGISRSGDLLDLAVEQDIIEKSGSWFSYEGEKIGQGRESAKKFLEDHPDIFDVVEESVRKAYGLAETEEKEEEPKEEQE